VNYSKVGKKGKSEEKKEKVLGKFLKGSEGQDNFACSHPTQPSVSRCIRHHECGRIARNRERKDDDPLQEKYGVDVRERQVDRQKKTWLRQRLRIQRGGKKKR